ncbi:hypothetical protein LTR37_013734 [Vermiconidia calcicola]|uniref:Uncharacterized protein n=1 Tax=Vermiconidia calcicola TaxID=1690605 RepID=A0ACC3MX71_9PEZI|nr:hypothetical protein LTR37_013734 [Vermiconidia calcicola]
MATMTPLQPQESPFFSKLAPELRNKIYRYVLVSNEEIDFSSTRFRTQTQFLHVCRQIKVEATQIFYAENTFLIDDAEKQMSGVAESLRLLVRGRARDIRKVEVRFFKMSQSKDILLTYVENLYTFGVDDAWVDIYPKLTRTLLYGASSLAKILIQSGVPRENIVVETPEENRGRGFIKSLTIRAMCRCFEETAARCTEKESDEWYATTMTNWMEIFKEGDNAAATDE